MCRLFGLIADSPVSLEDPLLTGTKPFIELSHKHHDGWGIGYFGNDRDRSDTRIAKAPVAAYHDERFSNLVKRLASPLAIVHLRAAKHGALTFQNTHPFYAEGWVFAHNGTIDKYKDIELQLDGIKFNGETDSERYFHLLLSHIRREGDAKQGIFSAIRWLEANHFHGGKNFLMSDGTYLYAYRHGRDLFYTVKETTSMRGNHSQVIAGPPLASLTGKTKMVLVSSEVLTDDDWREVPEDHLLVVDGGLQVTIEPVLDKVAVF